ncbi:MAG: DUF4445 domain-containing protein [Desulfovibrio sp.]|nr:DUF4445 domain-containing protein [Desulfovibrio sp.]MBI4960894.1 DUF4445 domain-containing protein [Desulfovibrio sp.]
MSTFSIVAKKGGPISEAPLVPGLTLAQHLFIAGAFQAKALCSGAGRCGLCQVKFLTTPPEPLVEEQDILSPGRLDEGWRLACKRPPVPGSVVEATLAPSKPLYRALPRSCTDAVLGIDLGTTSVHWRFVQGEVSTSGSFRNPQLGAGSEVMSRLALARAAHGAMRLRQAVCFAVRDILAGLPCLPGAVCLAGNTCMTYLALGKDISGLASAPYRVDWPGGSVETLDDDLPGVYIPPLIAPFVGGDVSAGLAALEFSRPEPSRPYLLADLGTNGEFALALPDGRFLLASVPMGPALEGVGMAQGMLAGPGAAVAFGLSPGGLVPVPFGGGAGTVRGISGTGYLSLLAKLLSLGVITEAGQFAREAASPLAARILAGVRRDSGEPRLNVGELLVHASDIEAMLKVKAAFETAVRILLHEAGMAYGGLSTVFLAGALGEHIHAPDLETLGFLPPGGAGKVRAAGNTSLDGACLAAARYDVRDWLGELPAKTRLVDVVSFPGFQKMYLESMRCAHAG